MQCISTIPKLAQLLYQKCYRNLVVIARPYKDKGETPNTHNKITNTTILMLQNLQEKTYQKKYKIQWPTTNCA
jgi:hypothetical protein